MLSDMTMTTAITELDRRLAERLGSGCPTAGKGLVGGGGEENRTPEPLACHPHAGCSWRSTGVHQGFTTSGFSHPRPFKSSQVCAV